MRKTWVFISEQVQKEMREKRRAEEENGRAEEYKRMRMFDEFDELKIKKMKELSKCKEAEAEQSVCC